MGDWHASITTRGSTVITNASAASAAAAAAAAATAAVITDEELRPRFSLRSPVLCRNGCVSSTQPLASSIGLDLLRRGGNAADTSIAVAAALSVLEPCSTGLGGDMFCLYYDSKSKNVTCVNGSGKSPQALTRQRVVQDCGDIIIGDDNDNDDDDDDDGSKRRKNNKKKNHQKQNQNQNDNNNNNEGEKEEEKEKEINERRYLFSPHTITVPGAARGWEDLLKKHGSKKFTLLELVEPAAKLAEDGFPVAPRTAHHWKNGMNQIKQWLDTDDNDDDDTVVHIPLTVDGKRAPEPGDIMYNPDMARVLRDLGSKGATDGFYNGITGKSIVDAIQKHGGTMTQQDLSDHTSSLYPEPISATYRGIQLWQVPPNGQGIAALIALKGLDHLERTGKCPTITPQSIGSADSYHVMIEMMRLGFQDGRDYVTCPDQMQVSNEWLLNDDRIKSRAEELFDLKKATMHGTPLPSSCTVSFQVVDSDGNAISFVNSNFMGFGTGLVPNGCGFTLQNRGFGFDLKADHPNCIAGGKRPYHTIIPGMLTHSDTQELYATFSNMGGHMQPQGHLQLMIDMVAGELNPQSAIDLPRFCIADGTRDGSVYFEDEIPDEVIDELDRRGHPMINNVSGINGRSVFGRAQIIKRNRENGVLWAGSDGRADGCAMGY